MKPNKIESSPKQIVGLSFVLAALLATASTSNAPAQENAGGDLPTMKSVRNPGELIDLAAAIEKCKNVVQRYHVGHVVIGHIVLDGPGDPREVIAQMPILNGGYFAGETKDLVRPVGFRMHQYAPMDVQLNGRSGEVVDLGEIHLAHLQEGDLCDLTGRIVLAGGEDSTKAKVELRVSHGPVNTPHNGTSPRSHWPKSTQVRIVSSGSVTAHGFSPIAYWCSIDAPGYVSQSREVTFTEGKTLDLGTVTLRRPRTAQLSYVIAHEAPFDLKNKQQASVRGGEKWKATSDIYGWDLEFTQNGDKLFFAYSYGPCSLTHLGSGTLEDFSKTGMGADSRQFSSRDEIESGHVYLLNQGHWKRWILFRVDIK